MASFIEDTLSPTFLIYLSVLFILSSLTAYLLATLRPPSFPPGPRGLPGFGNLLQLHKRYPFLTYSSWAKSASSVTGYDPNIPLGIKKGSNNVVVLNSRHLVRELFERRGAIYCDRPYQFMNSTWIFKHDLRSAVFQNSGPWLTRWRREFTNHFGAAAIARFRPVYEAEAARMLVKLVQRSDATGKELEALLICWIMSVPCLGVCGRRPDEMTDVGFDIGQFRRCSDEYAALVAPTVRDVFPILRRAPEWFGLAEWKDRARAVREGVLMVGTQFLAAAMQQREKLDTGKSIAWESVLAKMLRDQRDGKESMFTEIDIGNTAFHIVTAATSTSIAVFGVMLMALAKYPKVQERIRKEVLEVSGGTAPTAADMPKWQYTEAFWNEIHRWRPVAPQAIAHAPNRDDTYNGHVIPAGTAVVINVWHIQNNTDDYENPDEFNPDRFLHHPLGMRMDAAHDPAHIESGYRITYDFGAGRRVCPGSHVAKLSLMLGVAKILWAFDVVPAEGKVSDDIDLNLETGFVQEVALHPKSIDVQFKLRGGRTGDDVLKHYFESYDGEAGVMGWEDGAHREP